MAVSDDGRARGAAISLTTASVLASAFFLAGFLTCAVLPARVFDVVVSPSHAATQPADANEAAFLSENDKAMTRMMADMTIKPTGDADRDFVAMMIPHHQGAVDMAKALLGHGSNEQLRRIAQEIVVTQGQEIVAMRLAIAEPASPTSSVAKSSSAIQAPDGMNTMKMEK
jgi:Domain of unknown function (DUF305)